MLENTIKMLVNTMDYFYKDNLIDGVSTDVSGSNYVMAVDYSVENVKCTLTDGTVTLDATLYYNDRVCTVYIKNYTDGYNTTTLGSIITDICHYTDVLQRESDIEVSVTVI